MSASCTWCEKPMSYTGAARLRVVGRDGKVKGIYCSDRCASDHKDAIQDALTPPSREKVT